MDWASLYPHYTAEEPIEQKTEAMETEETASQKLSAPAIRKLTKNVEVADIGCGFGGLLIALAPVLPDTLVLGKDIWHHSLDPSIILTA